ncbi:hypothetical protein ACFRCG_41680 [Embleya sp. NPDC056575]|uniref:hypothetical protein n=1 Tax=unclassified Embleya TaxID=2699296 RepID=UPI0036C257B0
MIPPAALAVIRAALQDAARLGQLQDPTATSRRILHDLRQAGYHLLPDPTAQDPT